MMLFLGGYDLCFAEKKDKQKLNLSGRLYFEADYAQEHFNKGEGAVSDIFIRQARFSLKSKYHNNVRVKLSFDVENEGVELKDAFVQYKLAKRLNIQVGKFKEPFGLENKTSSSVLPTLERSMPSQTFSPSRSLGFAVGFASRYSTLSTGLFENEDIKNAASTYAWTSRATTAFEMPGHVSALLHIGASSSLRDYNEHSDDFDIEGAGELDISDDLVQIKDIQADNSLQFSSEAAYRYKSSLLQLELFSQSIDPWLEEGSQDDMSISAFGYYVQFSHYFGQKMRTYNKGTFGGVPLTNKKPVIEFVTRFSQLSLEDIDEQEQSVNNVVVGLNYYANNATRLMLQGVYSRLSERSNEDQKGYGAGLRLQYSF